MSRAILKANALFAARSKPSVAEESAGSGVTVNDMVKALSAEKAKVHVNVDDFFHCPPDADEWSRKKVRTLPLCALDCLQHLLLSSLS